MEKLEQSIAEDIFVRRFLRVLTGIILVFYTGYAMWMKATTHEVPFKSEDWYLILGSLCIWATWEAVRSYLSKKLNS